MLWNTHICYKYLTFLEHAPSKYTFHTIPRFLLGNMQQTNLNKADSNMGSYSKQKCSRSWVYSRQFHQFELLTPTKQVRACQIATHIWKSRQSLSGWNNILRSCNCSIFEECEEKCMNKQQEYLLYSIHMLLLLERKKWRGKKSAQINGN